MARVELHQVTKVYNAGDRPAVSDVSFTLEDGEILSLLGPSGCGKTTTLRLVAGFEWPDEGEIFVGGRQVAGNGVSVGPEKRGIGMVFQDYPLFPHKNVAQNIAFGLFRRPKAEVRRRVAEVLEQVGLEEYAGRYPHQLSGGQQQRVALAQALAPKPSVILLDEPFSNLDASLRHELRLQVRSILKASGASALLVTHDQKEAFAVGDRVAVMNQGRIEQLGTPSEVYRMPRTRFVAQFLGHSALLDGIVQPDKPQYIMTDLGMVPCALSLADMGEKVTVSLRPDSLIVDPEGPFTGKVESVVHDGHMVELSVRLPCRSGSVSVRTLVPPELSVQPGDSLRFAIEPERVAVIQ